MATPQSPAPALFGIEVADPSAKLKSTLKQMTEALRANAIDVADAPVAPLIGETPIGTNLRWVKVIQAEMDANAISYTPPTFAQGEEDNQEVSARKWAEALWDGLVAADYIA